MEPHATKYVTLLYSCGAESLGLKQCCTVQGKVGVWGTGTFSTTVG